MICRAATKTTEHSNKKNTCLMVPWASNTLKKWIDQRCVAEKTSTSKFDESVQQVHTWYDCWITKQPVDSRQFTCPPTHSFDTQITEPQNKTNINPHCEVISKTHSTTKYTLALAILHWHPLGNVSTDFPALIISIFSFYHVWISRVHTEMKIHAFKENE